VSGTGLFCARVNTLSCIHRCKKITASSVYALNRPEPPILSRPRESVFFQSIYPRLENCRFPSTGILPGIYKRERYGDTQRDSPSAAFCDGTELLAIRFLLSSDPEILELR